MPPILACVTFPFHAIALQSIACIPLAGPWPAGGAHRASCPFPARAFPARAGISRSRRRANTPLQGTVFSASCPSSPGTARVESQCRLSWVYASKYSSTRFQSGVSKCRLKRPNRWSTGKQKASGKYVCVMFDSGKAISHSLLLSSSNTPLLVDERLSLRCYLMTGGKSLTLLD